MRCLPYNLLQYSRLFCVLVCLCASLPQAYAQPATQPSAQSIFTVTSPDQQTRRLQTIFTKSILAETRSVELQNLRARTESGVKIETGNARGNLVFANIPLTLTDAQPFLCFSTKLRVEAADAGNMRVFVRPTSTSTDAQSEWIELTFDHHCEGASGENGSSAVAGANTKADETTLITNLAFLPKETRSVQLRLELSRTFLRRNPLLHSLEIFANNPNATNSELLTSLQHVIIPSTVVNVRSQVLSKNTAEVQNSKFPRPAFVTRTDWGCPWGQTSGPNTLTPTTPTHLIVHHSFSPGNSVTDWAAAVRGVWSYHVMSNGWSDVGYNWLIDPNGNIYQGRAWIDTNDNAQGAHFCGFNRTTMGVCMLGDFNSITPSEAAQKSLVRLLAYRASANGIDALATSYHDNSQRVLNNISGHRDGCATDCPGNMLYPLLPMLRSRVFAIQNPPAVRNPNATISSREAAQVLCAVRANGSDTDVFVEWDNPRPSTGAATINFANRRLVQRITASVTAETTVSTSLTNLDPTLRYAYRFVAQNSDTSATSEQRDFSTMSTSVQTPNQSLLQGSSLVLSPNPTSGEAHVWYRLEKASRVQLRVVSSTGTDVLTVFDGEQSAGEYRLPINANALANGVYYCQLQIRSNFVVEQKIAPIVVMK